MPNLHSLLAGAGAWAGVLQTAAGLALAAGVWAAARSTREFEAPLGIALIAGVLTGFHGYLTNRAAQTEALHTRA